MTKLLMVCLGNICRSPLAQGILESKLSSKDYLVDSAGTAAYHVGENPDPRSIDIAHQNSIDISKQRARQFTVKDFDDFDIIYAMDQSNFNNIINLARNDKDIAKVKLILDENKFVINKNVPDPYYGGVDGFKEVFELLEESCSNIANSI